jgi:hypothetical protein
LLKTVLNAVVTGRRGIRGFSAASRERVAADIGTSNRKRQQRGRWDQGTNEFHQQVSGFVSKLAPLTASQHMGQRTGPHLSVLIRTRLIPYAKAILA